MLSFLYSPNSHIHTWLLEKPWLWLDRPLLAMSLFLNMLSMLVIAFLPRSKRLVSSWLHSPSAVILEPKKIKSVTICIVSPSICHDVMTRCHDLSFLENCAWFDHAPRNTLSLIWLLKMLCQNLSESSRLFEWPCHILAWPCNNLSLLKLWCFNLFGLTLHQAHKTFFNSDHLLALLLMLPLFKLSFHCPNSLSKKLKI